jgi:hypothetical protein
VRYLDGRFCTFMQFYPRLDGIDLRLDTLDGRVGTLDARLGRIEADVHALRDEMIHRRECEDVLARVKYLEKKLGIESGV